MSESPLERICRQAREHDHYVVAHPGEFTVDEVNSSKLRIYQRERLSIASTLRYDD
jgi:hypothetical protein